MEEDDYEAERAVIGDLGSIDADSPVGRLEAAPGHTGDEVAEVLRRWRSEAPEDPLWKGIAETRVEERAASVHFHDRVELRDLEVGEAIVRCHLYDEEALAAAARGNRAG
jgi:hypothetical protein